MFFLHNIGILLKGIRMNSRAFMTVIGIALSFITIVIAVYLDMFGVTRASDQATWGAFGDYFGGILNPIFALFAFLGVLWSLDLQMKQVKQLSIDKQGEEVLLVVKDIDSRIKELMEIVVGGVDASSLQIHHMVAEAERGAGVLGSSDAYSQFIYIARQSGSLVEATVRELRNQIIALHSFLIRYPHSREGNYAPIIEHYTAKASRIVLMLREVGDLPEAVDNYFKIAQDN